MAVEKKNVLILSSWYPTPQNPFLGNFVQRQAQLLNETYNVVVINIYADNNLHKTTIFESEDNGFREILIAHKETSNPLKRRLLQKNALHKAFRIISKIDLIIGNIILPKGWQFSLAKKHYNAPLIYVEHGSYFRPSILQKWSLKNKISVRRTIKNVDAIVAVSDFLKKDLANFYQNKSIEVIGNSIDCELFNIASKKSNELFEFIHVSTLDPNTKNPSGLIDACEMLKNDGLSFHMTIVSDEPTSKWQAYVNNLELSDFISFVGPLKWEELPAYYQKSDAFVLFSDYETFSIVLAEAWACGIPTISTSVGIAYELDNKLGSIVNVGDSNQLYKTMKEYILRTRTFNANEIRNHSLAYSKPRILNKWIQLIDKHVN